MRIFFDSILNVGVRSRKVKKESISVRKLIE